MPIGKLIEMNVLVHSTWAGGVHKLGADTYLVGILLGKSV